ncbi:hypothetical protein KKF45_03590 [Patescibacteria group bacterium]|nr:hypothetical protein [Patescibacteria group bacterium]
MTRILRHVYVLLIGISLLSACPLSVHAESGDRMEMARAVSEMQVPAMACCLSQGVFDTSADVPIRAVMSDVPTFVPAEVPIPVEVGTWHLRPHESRRSSPERQRFDCRSRMKRE